MSQWAEVRHLHLVEGVTKKEIARRLKLDVKTVRRAVGRQTPPVRVCRRGRAAWSRGESRSSSYQPWRRRVSHSVAL